MTLSVSTLFVDRDGVINLRRQDHVKSLEEFEVLPGAIEALAAASRSGLDVIVMTNQSAIGRHMVTFETVESIHRELALRVTAAGGKIRGFLVCPHTPEDRCACRKPAPGLFFRARDELGVDLARAVMLGDQVSDVQAARAAGCAAILVDSSLPPDFGWSGTPTASSLGEAVELVLRTPNVNDAIILCGGAGSRLRGVLGDRPKGLALVHGRPFLEWLLLALAARGVARAVLAIGVGAAAIREHFASHPVPGLELLMSEESRPLGTAGAAGLAAQALGTSPILVLNGDSYSRPSLVQLALCHADGHAQATLWLERADRANRFGSVIVDQEGMVTGFNEKVAGSGLINAGVYLVEKSVLSGLRRDRPVSLEHDIFPALAGAGLRAVVGDGPFLDIGTPESLAAAESILGHELAALEAHS